MGKHYDEAAIPDAMRRNFDVYDRIKSLGIELGTFQENVVSLAGAGIAGVVFQESGLVYCSGRSGWTYPMNDDEDLIKHGQRGAQDAADTFAALSLPVDLRLTHAGVARAAVDAAGLTDVLARRALLDDVAGNGLAAVQGAFAGDPSALAFVQAALGGSGELALVDNLIALARTGLPGAAAPLQELREVAAALVATGRAVAIDFTMPFDFDYYSGVTWELRGEGGAWGRGGRYQPAGPGSPESACGFALDADRLSGHFADAPSRGASVAIVAEREAGLAGALRLASSLHRHGISAALGDARDASIRLIVGPEGISASSSASSLDRATLDEVVQFVLQHK